MAVEPESELLTAECCRRLVDGPPDDQYCDESADVVVEADAAAADKNVGDCGRDWYPNVAADAIYNSFIQTEIFLLRAKQDNR